MPPLQRSPRQRLADELSRPDAELNLATGALLIAMEEYPQISLELYLARLDQIAEEVRDRLADETAPLVVLGELIDTLFRRRGLRGNTMSFKDPRNSFLNDVLDRGLGVPLSLGIVVLEVGWRLGLPLEGVNFPGAFLVRYRGEEIDLLIDPFGSGAIYFEDQAQELLDRSYGGMVALRDAFLARATRQDMLARLLLTLKEIYSQIGDDRRTLAVVERILMIRPTAPLMSRSRGVLLARLGRHEEAVRQFEAYLRVSPTASDRSMVEAVVRKLRDGKFDSDHGLEA